MRICIITKYVPPVSTDGIPRTRWEYARQFTLLGHEVHIVTSGFKGTERLDEGIYIHEVPAWDQQVFSRLFSSLNIDDVTRNLLCYSYLVYERIKKLHQCSPLDIIDSPLWDIEGYITRIRMPYIPMIVRLETTSMLLREILEDAPQQKKCLNEIETHFMEIASGLVFDSWSILNETERLYHFNFMRKPYAVVHHGIEIKQQNSKLLPGKKDVAYKTLKVLIAGRLEKRKGSDLLVEKILPDVLSKTQHIEFHIVGKDSGQWDGFKEKYGVGYHDYLQKNFKKYINKQIFIYGYVTDQALEEMYEKSDAVLVLSKYESFGLLYLEAMQKNKPIVALKTGAVPEIFEDGKDALLIDEDSLEKISNALIKLQNDPALRNQLALHAFDKLTKEFSSELMAKKCIAFFKDLVYNEKQARVFQVMNCLTDKDGVSNTVTDFDSLLKQEAENTQILGTWPAEAVKHLCQKIESVHFSANDYVVYHYWNYCDRGEYFNNLLPPKKIFFFHNITPPGFFSKEDDAFKSTSKGFEQLGMFDNFDLYVCHTEYSANILKQAIGQPITTHIIPPIVDIEKIVKRKYDENLVLELRAKQGLAFIFVGSIAPHKKQTDIVRFFHYYLNHFDPNAHLYIVGGGSSKYTEELRALIRSLKISSSVTMTGKIPNEELYAYYRAADVFISMSEHEGFGVPLAEAMAFGLPVMAYRCTAIPDTVGENGCLFVKKDFAAISAITENLKNEQFRKNVIAKQNSHLKQFSTASVYKDFATMKTKAHENWHARISEQMTNGELMIDDAVDYNDERLIKNGQIKIVDDTLLFLEPNNSDSSIYVEEVFQEFEIVFLSHQWSGKAIVIVDEEYEEEFDLYSSERQFKKVRFYKRFPQGKHLLYIKPSGNRNGLSAGNEVLVDKIILRKNFHSNLGHFHETNNHLEPDIIIENEIPESFDDIDKKKFLRISREIKSTDSSIHYTSKWHLRDKYFYFLSGKSTDEYLEFSGDFYSLDITFLTHNWSGKVIVEIDGKYSEIFNLYNSYSEEKIFHINKLFPYAQHHVVIKPTGKKDNRSNGFEIFFKGLTIHKKTPIEIDDRELELNYKVSVVINTLNRAIHLRSLLAELEKQTYPYFEIVVVNGPSTDNTSDVLEQYEGKIKILSCPEPNLSMSRNIGIDNSSGDYVAFIDDDALPCDENWIENFVYFIIQHSDKKIGAIGGPVKHKNTQHYEFKNGATSDYGFQKFREEEVEINILNGLRWVQGVAGGNNIVSKKALLDIGGFDERFIYYLDETDLCIRLARKGYFIANNPVNYIRHFKAVGNNRKSTYEIRWDIIARSDTFYCLKNGHDSFLIRLFKTVTYFSKKHFCIELKKAYRENKIDKDEYKKYYKLMRSGFWQGIKWGITHNKNITYLKNMNSSFLVFKKTE
ncbi:MAG: glycosyltransferase [Bacteroidetes bacterium]|nr:glycosyltransferase [Bacteroidota bacterium]